MSIQEWNGSSYDRVSGVMEGLGLRVLERLELRGEETVLDAGCGSGRITQALVERLPRGRTIAVDASASMVQAARERLGETADVRLVDLLDLDLAALGLREPLDAMLSTATFHWVPDHERLFARLRAVLRPGGQLVAQCGGEGNITRLRGVAHEILARAPYAEHFADWRAPWNYAAAEVTEARLRAAGFATAKCWLAPAPSVPEHPREFLSTVVLGPHVRQLPERLRDPFMDELLAAAGEPVTIDYVRLNIDATA